MLLCKLFRTHLTVGRGIRMDYQTLHIGNICQKRENLQRINELPCIFLSAIDFERENACRSVRIIFLIKFMVPVIRKARMAHTPDFRMLAQEIHDLECILHVALNPQRQTLDTLQKNPCVERRDGRSGVTQNHGTDTGDESRCTCHVGKDCSVI